MARRLFCKLSHERGEKFSVAGIIYTIGADGFVEVADDHAPLLLQNAGKWADPATEKPTPFKRPSGPPQPILEDRNGNELSAAETAKLMQTKQPEEPAPPAEAPDPEPELAPVDWPTVTSGSKKEELLAVLDRLKAAGKVEAHDFNRQMSKMDLLEVIERAYDAMD